MKMMNEINAIQIRINLLESRGSDNKNIIKKLKRKLRALQSASK